jgi:DNA sulfur modification protein DndB
MQGKFGNTEFYLIQMKAAELTRKLTIPADLPEWRDQTLEEKFQRDISYSRVKKHIAPYLANDPERFFGAFIVDIYNGENVRFEPLNDVVHNIPSLYEQAGNVLGFLYMEGEEVLVPLDGQHRLAAIRFAISGRDEKDREIPHMEPNLDIGNDVCTVILVKHDDQKARKIFNKINRYAKSTSKSDNLITADDDIIAVISRETIVNEVIKPRLVSLSNTLPASSPHFTTLGIVYDSTREILEDTHGKIDDKVLPSPADQTVYKNQADEFWDKILDKIGIFNDALMNQDEAGDDKRIEIRQEYTLGKPIIQFALICAIIRLTDPNDDSTRLGIDEVCDRINQVNWRVDNPLWQRVLMNGSSVIAGKQSAKYASRFIAYYLGQQLDEEQELSRLHEKYVDLIGRDDPLPEPLF